MSNQRKAEGGIHDIPRPEPKDGAKPTASLDTVMLSDVRVEPIEFICPHLIATGKLTLIAGEPGLGKSMAVLSLAAIASSGAPWPGTNERREPIDVLVYNAEDGVSDTTAPRLIAAGADLNRVHILRGVSRPHVSLLDLQFDLALIEEYMRAHPTIRLLTLDPLQALIGRDVESHRNAAVRAVLDPLAQMVDRRRVAVLAIDHLNKSEGQSPINRLGGSIAFTAAARVVMVIVRDRNDPDRRLVAPIKINVAKDGCGFAFRIGDAHVENVGLVPRVEWETERIDITADEAMRADVHSKGAVPRKVDLAAEWLEWRLRTQGPATGAVIEEEAIREGISNASLRKARESLGIVSSPRGFGRPWEWSLPSNAVSPDDEQDWGKEASEEAKTSENVEEFSVSPVLSKDAGVDATENLNTDKTDKTGEADGLPGADLKHATTAVEEPAEAQDDSDAQQGESGVGAESEEERSPTATELVRIETRDVVIDDEASSSAVEEADIGAATTERDGKKSAARTSSRAKRKRRRRKSPGRSRVASHPASDSVVGEQERQCCSNGNTEETSTISSVSPVLLSSRETHACEPKTKPAKHKSRRATAAHIKQAKHARVSRGRGAARGIREVNVTVTPASTGGDA